MTATNSAADSSVNFSQTGDRHTISSHLHSIRLWLNQPVDVASIALYRIVFGLVMFVVVFRYFSHDWIRSYYITPTHFFSFHGFEWLKPWAGNGMYIHWGILGLLSLFISAGLFYRVSCILFSLGFAFAHFIDKTNYLNHYYLLAMFPMILSFIPANRTWSVDSLRDSTLANNTIPNWGIWLLRFQLGTVYFYGGVGKLNADWLFEAQPLKIWLSAQSGMPVIGPILGLTATAYFVAWAGAIYDLSIPFLLINKRTRPFALPVLVFFHLATSLLFQIGMFPWFMTLSATLFLDPSWPRKFVKKIRSSAASQTPSLTQSNVPISTFGFSALILFASLQLLLPLRCWLYPGNVNWTEEGFRFAWKVMLIEKSGTVLFKVHSPSTGKSWDVEPKSFLTPYQVKMMSTQPDMILTAAHWVAEGFRAKGFSDIEVRAETMVSFNGRPAQKLIDPTVDLAKEHESFSHKTWVLPLRSH